MGEEIISNFGNDEAFLYQDLLSVNDRHSGSDSSELL